jgi:FixJ family two-component response regulator
MLTALEQATVCVVDDDSSVRQSVSRLVRAAGFTVRTFSSPKNFLNQPLPQGPTCILLDMCMDGMNGLEVQKRLAETDRCAPIVFLSGHATVLTATAGMKHGAEDFLEKPFRPIQLLDAIRSAIEHDKTISAERRKRADIRMRYDTLTPREQEVMKLVVTGLLNKQAAAELGISEKTIKVHRARVMEKMQVESLAMLVQLAEKLGILNGEQINS